MYFHVYIYIIILCKLYMMLILHNFSQVTIHLITPRALRCEVIKPWQILSPSRAAHVGRLCKALGILLGCKLQ